MNRFCYDLGAYQHHPSPIHAQPNKNGAMWKDRWRRGGRGMEVMNGLIDGFDWFMVNERSEQMYINVFNVQCKDSIVQVCG